MSQIPDKDSDIMEEALEHKLEAEIGSREAKMEEELGLQQSTLSRITSDQIFTTPTSRITTSK